jgi:hypothetical protein
MIRVGRVQDTGENAGSMRPMSRGHHRQGDDSARGLSDLHKRHNKGAVERKGFLYAPRLGHFRIMHALSSVEGSACADFV